MVTKQRRWQQKQIENGCCQICGNEQDENSGHYCTVHLEYRKKYMHDYSQRALAVKMQKRRNETSITESSGSDCRAGDNCVCADPDTALGVVMTEILTDYRMSQLSRRFHATMAVAVCRQLESTTFTSHEYLYFTNRFFHECYTEFDTSVLTIGHIESKLRMSGIAETEPGFWRLADGE